MADAEAATGSFSFSLRGPRLGLAAPASDEGSDGHGRLAPGDRIGHFTLVRFIARGGMGQVWEARDEGLRKPVALKLVLPDRVDERSLALFAREARAGGRLAHANLVQTLGFGTDDGLTWIAQELVEGSWTLKDALDELRAADQVPTGYYRETARLVAGVAEGLQAAHAAGVIHRDVKPQNILIADDEPKVTDFGLARVADDSFVSVSGVVAGTWAYMSPEQVRAQRSGLDHRTDVFSLGIVLYEMLTLRRPFEGDTTHQIAERILAVDPPDPKRLRSQCPRELATIAIKALEKEPARRYATMAEFASDLRRHLRDEPIAARAPGALSRAAKWARRNPTKSTTAAVSSLAVVAVVGLLVRALGAEEEARQGWTRASEEGARAETERDRALEAQALAERRSYSAFVLATQAALDAGNLAEARRRHALCPEALRGWEWRHLGLGLDLPLWTGTDSKSRLESVAWSPSGDRLATVSFMGRLVIWDQARGVPLSRTPLGRGGLHRLSWSPDGERILVSGAQGALEIHRVEDGALLQALEGHGKAWIGTAAWSPDGARIVSSAHDDTVRVWDSRSGAQLASSTHEGGWAAAAEWCPDGSSFATLSLSGSLLVWDATSYESRVIARRPQSGRMELAWDPSGARIAVSSWDTKLDVWDVGSGARVAALEHGDGIECVDWSDDGTRIVTGCSGGSVQVWDATDWTRVAVLRAHTQRIFDVKFRPGGSVFASISGDETLCLWDHATGSTRQSLHVANSWLTSLALHPSEERVAIGSSDMVLRVLELDSGDMTASLRGHTDHVFDLCWSPQGDRLASAAAAGEVFVWDLATHARCLALEGHTGNVHSLDWSSDGTLLATASADESVRGWDARDGSQLWTVTPAHASATTVAWSPDSRTVAAAIEDGTERFFDRVGVELVRTEKRADNSFIFGIGDMGDPVAWSPAGDQVITGTDGGELLLIDAASGETRGSLLGHGGEVMAVAWHPDGARVASSSNDGTVRIWDPETFECLLTLEAREVATGLAWSHGGARLLASTRFGNVLIWESDLAQARALWRASDAGRRLRALVETLFTRLVLAEEVVAALGEDTSLTDPERARAQSMARLRGDPSPSRLNQLAWPLVDPERTTATDVALGLTLARALVKAAPDDPAYLDSLAWALFANGLHDEALQASERALSLAAPKDRTDYAGYVESLRAAIAASSGGAAAPGARTEGDR